MKMLIILKIYRLFLVPRTTLPDINFMIIIHNFFQQCKLHGYGNFFEADMAVVSR